MVNLWASKPTIGVRWEQVDDRDPHPSEICQFHVQRAPTRSSEVTPTGLPSSAPPKSDTIGQRVASKKRALKVGRLGAEMQAGDKPTWYLPELERITRTATLVEHDCGESAAPRGVGNEASQQSSQYHEHPGLN